MGMLLSMAFSHESQLFFPEIGSFTSKGRCQAISQEKKWDLIGALPKEAVYAKPIGSGHSRVALTERVVIASSARTTPYCPHVPYCGGCTLQHMDYAEQLRFKEEGIQKLFAAYQPQFFPILGCDPPWSYRNKMEFSFSQDKNETPFLGLNLAAGRGRVFNLNVCSIAPLWMSKTVEEVFLFWKKSGLAAFHPRQNRGTFRTLTLREGRNTQKKMVILGVSGNPLFAPPKNVIDLFSESMRRILGEEVSLFLSIHQAIKGHKTQTFEMHLNGKDHIEEKLLLNGKEYVFKISPSSFFQPNTLQAQKLYQRAWDLVEGGEYALDLFAGGATLGMIMADKFKEVEAFEINPYAVMDGKENLVRNAVTNVTIHEVDIFKSLKATQKQVDLVMVDPPRAGLGNKAIEIFANTHPKQILYISCNPLTQLIDLQQIIPLGYELIAVQPLDQFPHTHHIENICLLRKRER